jgi:hypothetical protein
MGLLSLQECMAIENEDKERREELASNQGKFSYY